MPVGTHGRVIERATLGLLSLALACALWLSMSPTAGAQIQGCWNEAPIMTQGYPQWTTAPAMVIDPARSYQAEIETSEGTITIDLDAAAAPATVNNFVCLASAGYYDFTLFHRIITGFMVQTGDPTGTGTGGPGYQFADELPTGEAPYTKGTVAMANAGPGSNGSQFFIVQADQPAEFPKSYSIFGRVSEGIDVLDALAAVPVQPDDRGEASDPIASTGVTSISILQDGQPMTDPAASPVANVASPVVSASPVAGVATEVLTPTVAPTTAPTTVPVETDDDDGGSNVALWTALGVAALAAVGYGVYRTMGKGAKGKTYTIKRSSGTPARKAASKPTTRATAAEGDTPTTARPSTRRRTTQSTRPSKRRKSSR